VLLSRYLYRDILTTIAALLLVLIAIYLSHRLILFLAEAGSGGLPVEFIFKLLILKLLWTLTILIPLTFFLAILLSLGRFYSDNEITAMYACGIGIPYLLQRSIILALLVAILVGFLSLVVGPWCKQQESVIREEIRRQAEISAVRAGRFQSFNSGRGVFYIEEINPDTKAMLNVFVALEREDKTVLLSSEKAFQLDEGESQGRYIVMFNGNRYDGKPGSAAFTKTDFQQHAVLINPPPAYQNVHYKARDSLDLWEADEARARAELQMRLSAPLTVLLLAPLAVMLSHSNPRQGRYAKMFLAILVYFSYINILEIAQKWVEQESVPPWIGLWWVHGLLLLVISAMYLRNFSPRLR